MCSFRIAAALVLATCGTPSALAEAEGNYRLQKGLLYRSGDSLDAYQKERCRLDLYAPAGDKGFATVVWFHGGGLRKGERSIPAALKGKGIAIAAPSYRLSPQVTAPAYLEDAAAAVAWVFKNIERFGGSRDRVFVSGHSAGGYLAAMVGLDKRWLAAHEIDADRIAGLIPYSGHTITHFTVRAERGIPGTRPLIDDLAPLYHVRKDAPPLLLLTGDRELEMLGRYEENAYLWRMMKVAGHPDPRLREIKGADHGTMVAPAHPLMLSFIKEIATSTP